MTRTERKAVAQAAAIKNVVEASVAAFAPQRKALAEATGRVVREAFAEKLNPLESRVAAIEQRLGIEKAARPRVRVPARTERV